MRRLCSIVNSRHFFGWILVPNKTVLLGSLVCVSCMLVALSWLSNSAREQGRSFASVVTQWTEALKEGDLDSIVSLYGVSEETTVVEPSGCLRKGISAVRDMYKRRFDQARFSDVVLRLNQAFNGGDICACNFTLTRVREGIASQEKAEESFHGTWILKKEGGKLSICREHLSRVVETAHSVIAGLLFVGRELPEGVRAKGFGGNAPFGGAESSFVTADKKFIRRLSGAPFLGGVDSEGIEEALFCVYESDREIGIYGFRFAKEADAKAGEAAAGFFRSDRFIVKRKGSVVVLLWHDGACSTSVASLMQLIDQRLGNRE